MRPQSSLSTWCNPRLDLAAELGATHTILAPPETGVALAIRAVAPVGVQLIVEATGVASVARTAVEGVVRGRSALSVSARFADDPETIMHWRERSTGQHMELGIAETNLVGLIAELGATWSRWGHPLFPIGVVYNPFVQRALEPWSYGIYAGGQSILVGTPSGVTLAAEGAAHQSITTPSVGLEQPGCVSFEPAFAIDVEWTPTSCA